MDLGLKGKVALVTGTGSQIGFGKGVAMVLAREGCNIIANDIDIEGAEKTAAEVRSLGCEAIAVKADISSIAEVREMVKTALKRFGKIDILVNNAGVCSPPKLFQEMPEEEWDPPININLKGVLNCTKAVVGHMVSRQSGKIISISSSTAKTGGLKVTVYGAAKAGIAGFTKGLAAELAPSGINVNCIAPGPGKTGFVRNAPPGFLEYYTKTMPLGKWITPEDVGNAAAFLASDVSANVTGQIFSVDGGMTMY
jgi:NAD(P)-dependent dehydrogenase (short-subunit alcohol dehydrogenase family)